MFLLIDVDSNSVSSVSGDTMDNTEVDMTSPSPDMTSDQAGAEVSEPAAVPGEAEDASSGEE